MSLLKVFGPGIVWAAAAIGSGELIVTAKTGIDYGLAFAWALILGCVLKYVIHRAILDVSLLLGRPIVDDWHVRSLGVFSTTYWLLFFVATATGVAGLIGLSASAAQALIPIFSVKTWAIILTVCIITLAFGKRYERYEKWMLAFGLTLFLGTCLTVVFAIPSIRSVPLFGFPDSSGAWLVFLALLGWGAGSGPDLMLPYSWWVAEKKGVAREWVRGAHIDLAIGYVVTGFVATMFMLAGAFVLAPLGVKVEGMGVLRELSKSFVDTFGTWAAYPFFATAFAALFSTAIGVFDGGRIALAHLALLLSGKKPADAREIRGHWWYRSSLVVFSIVPLCIFLGAERPVMLVLIAGALSAVSMPLLGLQALNSLVSLGRPARKFVVLLMVAILVYAGFTVQALFSLR